MEPTGMTDHLTRTGHFIIEVRRKGGGAWDWQVRVEVVRTGQWGVFDSIPDLLRFVNEHMAAETDGEGDGEELFRPAVTGPIWLDEMGDEASLLS